MLNSVLGDRMVMGGRTLALAAVALCGVAAGPGGAQTSHQHGESPKPVRPAETVRGPAAPFSSYPTPHFDAKGRLWVAFLEGDFVYVTSSLDKGVTFERATRVNAQPEKVDANGENRPKVATSRDGSVVVTWTKKLSERMTAEIRLARSTDGGRSFSPPITINDDSLVTGHRFDALAIGPAGEVVVAWIDKRDREAALKRGETYKGAALYYAVSTDGGRSFAANRKVKDGICECCRLAIAFDPQGVPVVVWRDIMPGGIRDHSLARLASTGPSVTRATFDGWKIDACPHHGPSLAIAADGTHHLAWFTGDGSRGGGIFYARSSDGGASFSTPVRFVDVEHGRNPSVLSLGGNVFVVWRDTGEGAALMSVASADAGKTWGQPRQLAHTKHGSDHPLLLTDGREPLVSWFAADEGYLILSLSPKTAGAPAGAPGR